MWKSTTERKGEGEEEEEEEEEELSLKDKINLQLNSGFSLFQTGLNLWRDECACM